MDALRLWGLRHCVYPVWGALLAGEPGGDRPWKTPTTTTTTTDHHHLFLSVCSLEEENCICPSCRCPLVHSGKSCRGQEMTPVRTVEQQVRMAFTLVFCQWVCVCARAFLFYFIFLAGKVIGSEKIFGLMRRGNSRRIWNVVQVVTCCTRPRPAPLVCAGMPRKLRFSFKCVFKEISKGRQSNTKYKKSFVFFLPESYPEACPMTTIAWPMKTILGSTHPKNKQCTWASTKPNFFYNHLIKRLYLQKVPAKH